MVQELTDALNRILSEGLTLSDAAMHYIDSTFDCPDAHKLKAILVDEDDCERDPLIELLFSPDEATQIRLEKLLQRSSFDRQDCKTITDHLMKSPATVKISLPDNRGQLEIQLPLSGAERLVGLLHIEKHIPEELQKAIEKNAAQVHADRIRVMFRNARCRFCERDVSFLSRALAGFDLGRPTDVDSLEYALTVLTDSPSPADIYHVLMQRKKIYGRELQSALKREEQLKKSNPEIMMLQGKRMSGIDVAEARRLIAMIDRISLAVFDRTEPALPLALEAEYDIHNRDDALQLFY